MTFFSKKESSIQLNILFSFLSFNKILHPEKRLVTTCIFECFQSQCHILELHIVLCMKSALTIFGDGSFIFKFVSYGLMTKPLEIGCTIYEVANKAKRLKVNVNPFATKLK